MSLTTKDALLERMAAATEALAKDVLAKLVPTGAVQAFAGTTTPDGWLFCDGSSVSRTDYVDLYSVIGDTYGNGDGSTTFNLPNLVDKFIEGSATAGTVKAAGLPNITGDSVSSYSVWNSSATEGENLGNGSLKLTVSSNKWNSGTGGTRNTTGMEFDASLSSSIYGNSTTVQPPALTMRYIIKY